MKELKHEQGKMARKARVKVLRGTRAAIANSEEKLEKGELLLDTTDGYIIAGLNDYEQLDSSAQFDEDQTYYVLTSGIYVVDSSVTSSNFDEKVDGGLYIFTNNVNNSSHIIKVREVVGYANDSTTLNGSSGYENSKYSLSYSESRAGVVLDGGNNSLDVVSNSSLNIGGYDVNIHDSGEESGSIRLTTKNNRVWMENSLNDPGVTIYGSNIVSISVGCQSTRCAITLSNASGDISLESTGKINLNTNTNISSDGNTLNVGQVAKIGNIEINNSSNKNQITVDNVVGHSNQTTINGNILKSNEIDTTTLKVDSISNNSSTNITINSGNNEVVVNGYTNVSSGGKKLTVGSIEIDNSSNENKISVGNLSAATKVSTPKIDNGGNAVDIANISNVSKIAGNSNQTDINGNILKSNEVDTTTVKVDAISNNSSNSDLLISSATNKDVKINTNTVFNSSGNKLEVGSVVIDSTTQNQTSVTANQFNGNFSGNVSGDNATFSSYVSASIINSSTRTTSVNDVVLTNSSGRRSVETDYINVSNAMWFDKSNYGGVSILDKSTSSAGGVSIGNVHSSGTGSITIGNNSISEQNCVAIGNNAIAREDNCVAIGNNAITRSLSDSSVAIGHESKVIAPHSVALGYNASASAGNAIQLGNGSNTNDSTLQFMNTKIADGYGNVFTGFSKDWLQDKTVSQMIDDLFCGNQPWGVIVVTSNISDQEKAIGVFTHRPFSRPQSSTIIGSIFGIQSSFEVGAESSKIGDYLIIKYPSGSTDSLSYEDKPYYKIIF